MFAQHSNYLVKSYDCQEAFNVTGMQGIQEFRTSAKFTPSIQCGSTFKKMNYPAASSGVSTACNLY